LKAFSIISLHLGVIEQHVTTWTQMVPMHKRTIKMECVWCVWSWQVSCLCVHLYRSTLD